MEESEGKKWVDFSFGEGAFSESEGRLGTKNSLSGRKINWDVHFVFQARQRSGGVSFCFGRALHIPRTHLFVLLTNQRCVFM